jgi:hypothetical protein
VGQVQGAERVAAPELHFAGIQLTPTRQETREYRRATKPTLPRGAGMTASTAMAVGVMAFLVLSIVVLLTVMVISLWLDPILPAALILFLLLTLLAGAVAMVCVSIYRRESAGWPRWSSRLRLARFSAANGRKYTPFVLAAARPGAIFRFGKQHQTRDIVQTLTAPYIEVGNHQCVGGAFENNTTHRWGYFMVKLERRLPHMVLVSRKPFGKRRAATFPLPLKRNQVLSLEGDFNSYFTLYVPQQYERDALYIFNPAVMARLVDEAAGCHVEIIDDWMYVYRSGGFDLLAPSTWQVIERIAETVGASTSRAARFYRDDRMPASASAFIAPGGRRLRIGVPIGAVAFGAAMILIHVFQAIH